MGIYLNSPEDVDGSKEVILRKLKSKRVVLIENARTMVPEKGKALLCLVINPFFNALGVMYSKDEQEAFTEPDSRSRAYLEVDIEEIKPFLADQRDLKDITLGQ